VFWFGTFLFQLSYSVFLALIAFCSVQSCFHSILFGAFGFYLFLLIQFDNS